MDLSKLTLAELKNLAIKVKDEIGVREKDEVKKAREEILAIAQSVGVPLSELLGTMQVKGVKSSKPVDVKFRHPGDTSKTWTGRGRKPSWVLELEESGKIESARV